MIACPSLFSLLRGLHFPQDALFFVSSFCPLSSTLYSGSYGVGSLIIADPVDWLNALCMWVGLLGIGMRGWGGWPALHPGPRITIFFLSRIALRIWQSPACTVSWFPRGLGSHGRVWGSCNIVSVNLHIISVCDLKPYLPLCLAFHSPEGRGRGKRTGGFPVLKQPSTILCLAPHTPF